MSATDAVKTEIDDLVPGMYVCELDRPWLETPFLFEGIKIESRERIEELRRHCAYVYVDPQQSDVAVPGRHPGGETLPGTGARKVTPFHGPEVYADVHSVEEELPAAREIHGLALQLTDQVMQDLKHDLKLDVGGARRSADALRDSVVRNPDALLLLNQLRAGHRAEFGHAIHMAIYMLALGRHLGLPRAELSVLGLGGLLMDIGYLRFPPDLVQKGSRVTAAERELLKNHVTYGEEIVAQSFGIPNKVGVIVARHHEREDGNGFPRRLNANQLEPYGRMAAVVSPYEEHLYQGVATPVATPLEALKVLQDMARWALNATLVDQFAQCLGLFPVGSLVELNSGEVGIVITHNRSRSFKPRVMVILDEHKKRHDALSMVDLRHDTHSATGRQYAIVRDLNHGAYGVDPKEYYL